MSGLATDCGSPVNLPSSVARRILDWADLRGDCRTPPWVTAPETDYLFYIEPIAKNGLVIDLTPWDDDMAWWRYSVVEGLKVERALARKVRRGVALDPRWPTRAFHVAGKRFHIFGLDVSEIDATGTGLRFRVVGGGGREAFLPLQPVAPIR